MASDREKGRKFFRALDNKLKDQIGDDLVLGTFDWRDWDFEEKPSAALLNGIEEERLLWEST